MSVNCRGTRRSPAAALTAWRRYSAISPGARLSLVAWCRSGGSQAAYVGRPSAANHPLRPCARVHPCQDATVHVLTGHCASARRARLAAATTLAAISVAACGAAAATTATASVGTKPARAASSRMAAAAVTARVSSTPGRVGSPPGGASSTPVLTTSVPGAPNCADVPGGQRVEHQHLQAAGQQAQCGLAGQHGLSAGPTCTRTSARTPAGIRTGFRSRSSPASTSS